MYFIYLTFFVNPENIREVTSEDIEQLLRWIRLETDYQTVVLDIGTNVRGVAKVLAVCSKIYCLRKKGYLFEIQMQQFLAYMEKAEEEDVLNRMEQIELPGQVKVLCGGPNLLEQLDWSEFGDFVRSKM